ncbi:hypothetical protein P389DRAFT_47495 [Cystobasidium minutum MCA 4210]|uniref:uncharacterized protein n=1 Tax=Cystobasidium minutum MCA 4210 TaxID=1397322 RepID=UPI0034CD05D4|eukprot:jgi/Rhomi1/47495/CE47494_110
MPRGSIFIYGLTSCNGRFRKANSLSSRSRLAGLPCECCTRRSTRTSCAKILSASSGGLTSYVLRRLRVASL